MYDLQIKLMVYCETKIFIFMNYSVTERGCCTSKEDNKTLAVILECSSWSNTVGNGT